MVWCGGGVRQVLCGKKRVAVSSTPGKTKHFQTIILNPQTVLCDCPGLVFPTFMASRSNLVINGVLPIDQMHDYLGPIQQVPGVCFFLAC